MDHEAAEAYPAALSPASCVRLQLYYSPSSFGIGPHVTSVRAGPVRHSSVVPCAASCAITAANFGTQED